MYYIRRQAKVAVEAGVNYGFDVDPLASLAKHCQTNQGLKLKCDDALNHRESAPMASKSTGISRSDLPDPALRLRKTRQQTI